MTLSTVTSYAKSNNVGAVPTDMSVPCCCALRSLAQHKNPLHGICRITVPVLAVSDDWEEGGEVQGEEPGALLSCGLCLALGLGLLGCQL